MERKKLVRKPEPPSKRGVAWPRWTGFRGMTIRDWLQLLVVPLALVVISLLFAAQQDQRQQKIEDQRAQQAQKIEDQRAEAERELAKQSAQDDALQAYLDQMSSLLLEKDLRDSKKDSEVRTLARARTVTVLGRLDPDRKTQVMQFLVEAKLVQSEDDRDPIIALGGADLNGADLSDADLRHADLRHADLSDANLRYANLSHADLIDTILSDADLSYANLSGAILSDADLSDADLYNANLSGANLIFAKLSDANLNFADLSEADLIFAKLSEAHLVLADLSDADLGDADLRHARLLNARLSNAVLKGADLRGADLGSLSTDVEPGKGVRVTVNTSHAAVKRADLRGADLRDADLEHAKGVTKEQLASARTLEGATMPNGQKYEDWLKDKEDHREDKKNRGSS